MLTPGTHGSTFGGNPLACAVGLAVVELLRTGEPQRRARELGAGFQDRLAGLVDAGLLDDVRGLGLWAGLDLDPARGRDATCARRCSRAASSPGHARLDHPPRSPLTITTEDLETGLSALEDALTDLAWGR